MTTYCKGHRVIPSGYGRTATWGDITGTVTKATKRSIYVHWDGCSFEDELEPRELNAAELIERPEFPIYYDAQGREHAEF